MFNITARPPSTEVHDPDNSSQGVKRRLSPEIKQKLSKVARLAVLNIRCYEFISISSTLLMS